MSGELAAKLRAFADEWDRGAMNTEIVHAMHRTDDAGNLVVHEITTPMLRAAADALDAVAVGAADASADYERFMREWKQVGVWQGGKPVRAKLARLAKAGQLLEVWAGLERLRNDPNRPDPQYIPRPMTWLNQERWNDDPYPPKSGGRQAAAGAVLGIDLGQPAALPESTQLAVSRGELHQSLTNPLATRCPVCNASPGERCSQPTNSGRVAVSWVHSIRQSRA